MTVEDGDLRKHVSLGLYQGSLIGLPMAFVLAHYGEWPMAALFLATGGFALFAWGSQFHFALTLKRHATRNGGAD